MSSLFNSIYRTIYNMGRPISENFIKSGPQKLINNVIKISRSADELVLNKHISQNIEIWTYGLPVKSGYAEKYFALISNG